jgi:hypothetical protein
MHGLIINIQHLHLSAVEELLNNGTDINKTYKGGRTALHLAASYSSPEQHCIWQPATAAQLYTSFCLPPVVDTNIRDAVLRWTPLRYAEGTKSWMAVDISLQNGVNPNDSVLTRPNS